MSNVAEIIGTASVNRSENLFKCADRVSPGDLPVDITTIKEMYIPFVVTHKEIYIQRNVFGADIFRQEIRAGSIYDAYDGKRLVIEVGCKTVIYININQQHPEKHHRLFIQSDSAFSGDTTLRHVAAVVSNNTRHVETIVKYEFYFLMGVLSTVSIPVWLAITGSDVSYMIANKKTVANSSKKLAKSILIELSELKQYAPTLHQKILELIVAEASNTTASSVKRLPSTIINDEKTQAQVAGIIFGKWAIPNGNSFNAWTIMSVLLSQAAIKSVTKFGDAYIEALDTRYKEIAIELRAVELSNKATLQRPVKSLIAIMKETGVTISHNEARLILTEIGNNKAKAFKNLRNIARAIEDFRKETRS